LANRRLQAAFVAVVAIALIGCTGGSQATPVQPSAIPTTSAAAPRPTYTTAPGGPFEASMVEGLTVEVDVPYTDVVTCGQLDCQAPLDILAPAEPAGPLPTYVFVPGGNEDFAVRRYMDVLAAATASRGAVVFLIAKRNSATGNGDADSLTDIRCALQFASAKTGDYGGDPEHLILLGHSIGSRLVIRIGVSADSQASPCLADADVALTSIVGLAGFEAYMVIDASSAPRFVLAGGSEDPNSDLGPSVVQQLQEAGFTADYTEFEGATHEDMVNPDTPGLMDMLFSSAVLDGR